jgi:hypothetical protein
MNEYLLGNQITVITNATRDLLLEKNPDSLILYNFYIKGANYQGTESVWHQDIYVRQGLKWGSDRFARAKKVLIEHNLIETFKSRKKDGTFGKTYIRIKYLFKQETRQEIAENYFNHNTPNPVLGIEKNIEETLIPQQSIHNTHNPVLDTTSAGFEKTNALSNYKLNALSNLNINALSKGDKKSKSKKTKDKSIEDLNATEREILDLYNSLFRSKRPSIDTSWVDNFNHWLGTYNVDVIKEAIINWEKYPHWSKDGNSKNGLPWLFRTRDRSGNPVNYIDQLLALGETKVANDGYDEYFPSDWWEKAIK